VPHRWTAIVATAILCGAGISAVAKDMSFGQIERGRYLTDAGDCVSCHTADGGKPYAGARAIETPFGKIYSPNITPDRETGIGAWSDDEFYHAMHDGIGPDGARLYPAFPYPYFTKLTRDDVNAIRAYLNTLPPVNQVRPANALMWPLNYRVFMRGWDWMYFKPGTYVPHPDKSAEWNRGAYLVEGAAHCGACHTPKSITGADKTSDAFTGGNLQNWFAPNLTANAQSGLGNWSTQDIVEYLKTGRNRFSGATGLMSEVVSNSTSKLTDADLKAIAIYLKDVTDKGSPAPSEPDHSAMSAGAAVFNDSCAACHRRDGKGVPRMFPPLAHNANVQAADPASTIRVILQGAQTVVTDARPTPSTMPAYNWKLTDAQIAAVATYVRNQWGNAASPVSAGQVTSLRKELQAKTQ
jgi:mono/diheme cytochrome c family protein